MYRFSTHSEMLTSGFVSTDERVIEDYKGCEIRSTDVSGASSFGCAFAITVSTPAYANDHPYGVDSGSGESSYWAENIYDKRFAVSTNVWLTDELNAVKKPGCVSVKYAPQDYQRGLVAARSAIDSYRKHFPELTRRDLACHYGFEKAIDDEITRLRNIDANAQITDPRLASVCRNTIVHYRPDDVGFGDFKTMLLSGGGGAFIDEYLSDTDRVFNRLYNYYGTS